MMSLHPQKLSSVLFSFLLLCCGRTQNKPESIDRNALVTRHNVHLSEVDTLGSLSVGNGAFTFTVDVTGLQTFYREYENGIPLGTQAEWAWHTVPSAEPYTLDDVAQTYTSCNDKEVPYATQRTGGKAGDATEWLRANPHRLHLGLIGLTLLKEDGTAAGIDDLKDVDQTLDLWSGTITSKYTVDGSPVQVELHALTDDDGIAVRINSPMIDLGRLKVWLKFPYGKECHVCPGYDFENPDRHKTNILSSSKSQTLVARVLDSTRYYASIESQGSTLDSVGMHEFEIVPSKGGPGFEFSVKFSEDKPTGLVRDFASTSASSANFWKAFWTSGAAVDFSNCTDARAAELERRVVLSQYLTRIQCAGTMPPQETGLTMNSWYGKFHLEMHWWHGVHFALWGRPELLERSMGWYEQILDNARHTAAWQGYEGARWPKMTDPSGNESPSSVGAFLAWQQPHPIYYAELLYRVNPGQALDKYREIVFETAEFMASFAQRNPADQKFHLCPPLIPAQEIFLATETSDPPFELAYWHYALTVAQKWRVRAGLQAVAEWQEVIDNLAPLPRHEGLYLPAAGATEAYTNDEYRRDHPVVTGAYGVLPLSDKIERSVMSATFDEIMSRWNWETTWGWDYPMLAMSAARLGKPNKAIDALLLDVQKNTYLFNGHNYQDERLRLYLPGNGGLLTAVAMMAAGWDGAEEDLPGFPKDGTWDVRWEGLRQMP